MKIYMKYKEKILYLFFGVLTTLISLLTYYILTFTILNVDNSLELQIANIISWITGILFAYFTNREYVFNSNNKNIKEFIKFILSRIFTLLLDMLIMYVFVTKLKYNNIIIKLVSQVVVIVTNYILSKLIVFKK